MAEETSNASPPTEQGSGEDERQREEEPLRDMLDTAELTEGEPHDVAILGSGLAETVLAVYVWQCGG